MRRLFAFLLGILFGVILVVGAVAGVAYYAYAKLTPEQISAETNKFMGDFSKMSVKDMIAKVQEIYATKVNLPNDMYTIGEFFADNHIDAKTAFGMELPQEVLDIPLFEMTNGDAGFEKAMNAIKVSTIPAIVNMFGATDENGNLTGMFGQEVMQALSEHTLSELTAEGGMATVLEGIKLVWLLPNAFPAEDSANKLMHAVGQADLGKLLGSVSGSSNLLAQLSAGGGLESLGQLSIMDIAGTEGGGSDTLKLLLGDAKVVDLIDENGNLNPDQIINGLQIGSLVGLKRLEVTSLDGYENLLVNNDTIKLKGDNLVMLDGEKWYKADVVCTNDLDGHLHNADCYGYIWYEACQDSACDGSAHNHVTIDEEKCKPAEGLYKVLAQLSIQDLMGGDQNALMDKFTGLTLRELMAGQTISGVMESLADMTIAELMDGGIDNILVGELLGMKRYDCTDLAKPIVSVLTPLQLQTLLAMDGETVSDTYVAVSGTNIAMSTDGETWYWAQLVCTTEGCTHKHANGHPMLDCYGYKWYVECLNDTHNSCDHETEAHPTQANYYLAKGLMALLGDYSVARLNNIQDVINKVKLGDVMDVEGTMLETFADTPIGELAGKIETMRLGYALSYKRTEVVSTSAYTTVVIADKVLSDGSTFIRKLDGETEWYIASLVCTANHEHTESCYSIWTKEDDSYATGLEGKLADEKIDNLGNMQDIINDIYLGDVMDVEGTMLETFANTPIGQLSTEIEQMRLGYALGYTRTEVKNVTGYTAVGGLTTVKAKNESVIRQLDGETEWYQASLVCTANHTHEANCYSIWTKEDGTFAKGVEGKLSDEKLSDMGDLSAIINDFTLGDVMGENVPSILANLTDTKIGELEAGIDGLYLADFLEYTRKEVDTTHYLNVATIDNVKSNGVEFARLESSDGTWYEAKFSCSKEHAHTTDCYGYVWYQLTCANATADHKHSFDNNCYTEVTGITSKLAGKRVSQLQDLETIINEDVTLADVMGENIPDMLVSIKDTPIGQLGTAIETLYVGDAMSYKRTEVTELTDFGTASSLMNGTEVKYYLRTKGTEIVLSDDQETWYKGVLHCTERADSHTHVHSCYGYEWLELICTTEHDHVDNCYTSATGITAKLANEKINNLGNIQDTIDTFKLSDVIDIDENSPHALQSLKDTEIGKLGDKFNDLTVSEVIDVNAEGTNKLFVELADVKINELGSSINGVHVGSAMGYELICNDSTHHDHVTDCYNSKNTLTCGKVAHTKDCWAKLICTDKTEGHVHTTACYEKATGIVGAIVDMTIEELGQGDALKNRINDLTLGEIIDIDQSNKLLYELSGTKVGNLSKDLNAMRLGVALGFSKLPVDVSGYTYVAKLTDTGMEWLTGTINEADHSEGIYLKATTNDITTAEFALSDHGINGAYYQATFDCHHTDNSEHTTHNLNCFSYDWYQDDPTCENTDENHTHEQDCYHAKGLNSKIASLTINNLAGDELTSIITSLTIGELMDSGMMSLGETPEVEAENIAKFNIIFHDLTVHNGGVKDTITVHIKETVTIGGITTTTDIPMDVECSMEGYFTYINSTENTSSTPAQTFFSSFTHAEEPHWKEMKLSDFISELLNAL